jgi:hypothetical protein
MIMNTYQTWIYQDVLHSLKLPNELKWLIISFCDSGYPDFDKCIIYMKHNLRIHYTSYTYQINKTYYLFDREHFPKAYMTQQDDYAIMIESWLNKKQRIAVSICKYCGNFISFCAKVICKCNKTTISFDYNT